jgi:hypothetical protein
MQQPLRPSDSVTAQLACQLERAKEQVQRYADLAEAAQQQAGSTVEQATQHVSLGSCGLQDDTAVAVCCQD